MLKYNVCYVNFNYNNLKRRKEVTLVLSSMKFHPSNTSFILDVNRVNFMIITISTVNNSTEDTFSATFLNTSYVLKKKYDQSTHPFLFLIK